MRTINYLTILLATILFSSCATLYKGSRKAIHFSSDPQKAEISINGKVVGETPLTVKVGKSLGKREVTVKKDGFKTQKIKLEKKFAPISILSNTLIPIDMVSGAMLDYKERYYHKELTLIDKNQNIISNYNLEDNFYVITREDTIYTSPFQDFTKQWLLSQYLKDMKFDLLDGTAVKIPANTIYRYKTLEIYNRFIGFGFLTFKYNVDFNQCTYVSVKIDENEEGDRLFMFMEELLYHKGFQLIRSYKHLEPFSKSSLDGRSFCYYLCEEGKIKGVVEQDKLLATVRQFFEHEKELITKLKKKNKFKVLAKHVYEKRRK